MSVTNKFTGTSWLVLYASIVSDEIRQVEDFVLMNAKNLSATEGLEAEYDEALKKIDSKDDEARYYLEMRYEDEAHEIFNLLPTLVFHPSYVYLYGLFEHNLRRVLTHELHIRKIDFDKETLGSIESMKKTINKLELNCDPLHKHWDAIQKHKLIRNAIMHHGAELKSRGTEPIKDSEIYKFIKKNSPEIKLVQGEREFRINSDQFLFKLTTSIMSFFDEFFGQLLEQEKKRKKIGTT